VNDVKIDKKLAAVAALLLLAAIPPATAQDEGVPVTFGWAPCATVDGDGLPLAPAVRYEVYLQRGDQIAELLATVEHDTSFVLNAERGVIQRIRVVGYDSQGRPSPPSEWSDPVYFDPDRGDHDQLLLPPVGPQLGPNYPNPFNPETRIAYGVPEGVAPGTRMALEIYNLRGQRLRTFPVTATPGWHEVTWNGLDDRGQMQSTGTYITRYIYGDQVQVGKMTMVK
jgi:hypothetical protein